MLKKPSVLNKTLGRFQLLIYSKERYIENYKKASSQVTLDIHLKGGFLFVLYKPFIRYRKDTPLPIPGEGHPSAA